jgi:hypothetical protein
MQEISEEKLLEALNAEDGTWKEVPFPTNKIPEGHSVKSVQGTVGKTTWLICEFKMPDGQVGYDGTATVPPALFIHITPDVAKAAFLKGQAWLEKQNQSATQ